MKETLTIRVDGELMRGLESEARRAGTSKGKIVRDAIRERLRKQSRTTALDALSSLCGIMEGPSDLSTNKKYLANFGKGRRTQ